MATTPSAPASSSPPLPWDCLSHHSPPSGWPRSFPQRSLIVAGFLVTIAGVGVLLLFVTQSQSNWAFVPGLLLIGLGLGGMLTPSVNVVQSSFPEHQQGEISGLSRSISNLGSSLGAAIAGTILIAGITSTPSRAHGLAMITLAAVGVAGLLQLCCCLES